MHNEALQRLDALVAASVEEPPRLSPPTEPLPGQCYIAGPGATGAWSGRDNCLAAYTAAGWRLIPPVDGMVVYVRSARLFAQFRDGRWEQGALRCASVIVDGEQVVGRRGNAIAAPAGGNIVDAEARSAITAILSGLRAHGLIKT